MLEAKNGRCRADFACRSAPATGPGLFAFSPDALEMLRLAGLRLSDWSQHNHHMFIHWTESSQPGRVKVVGGGKRVKFPVDSLDKLPTCFYLIYSTYNLRSVLTTGQVAPTIS